MARTMDIKEIKKRFEIACYKFLEEDAYLIAHDVNERTLCHRLAFYLEPFFRDYNIDCEYNRNGNDPKRIIENYNELKECYRTANSQDDIERVYTTKRVYPDIIVHKRGSNSCNLLVVEAKKPNNQDGNDNDFSKLMAFTGEGPYNYTLGVWCLFKDKHKIELCN